MNDRQSVRIITRDIPAKHRPLYKTNQNDVWKKDCNTQEVLRQNKRKYPSLKGTSEISSDRFDCKMLAA